MQVSSAPHPSHYQFWTCSAASTLVKPHNAMFIKERRAASLSEVAEIAERYTEVHPLRPVDDSEGSSQEGLPSRTDGTFSTQMKEPARRWFICNSTKYLARECAEKLQVASLECEGRGFPEQGNRKPRRKRDGRTSS